MEAANNATIKREFGKSDDVLAPLAQLPYVVDAGMRGGIYEGPVCALYCPFANWSDCLANWRKSHRLITEGTAFVKFNNPNAFGLTAGDRETPVMILDVELGIVHWEDCPTSVTNKWHRERVDYGDGYGHGVSPEEEAWRQSAEAWTIPDFFEVLKNEFRSLTWMPLDPCNMWEAGWPEGTGEEGIASALRDVYRQHGWPDLSVYNKKECMEAIRNMLKERYPAHAEREW
ncbi:hypothetical protein jhhlp_003776 [Lomentospora prolificans]|uniref:Uncharacterized protein n=1 Tax=Lomentospora prolificans TaxID=41688 RepID=A0A2N3N9W4_9PEZI|nr:hypothetical protein jhhlp_003776 [Lomentospora prolificans]